MFRGKKLGYKIFIVTNQSGIGRGYFSENQFQNLSKWIENYFQTKILSSRNVLLPSS